MSFFTSSAYAGFHQHPPPQLPSTKPGPLPKTTSNERRRENASDVSSGSTASMSEFDPLSPINLQRAADPWHGNNHIVTSPTSTASSNPLSIGNGSPIGGAHQMHDMRKVFLEHDDGEWGEFMEFSPRNAKEGSPPRAKREHKNPEDDEPPKRHVRLRPWNSHDERDDDQSRHKEAIEDYRSQSYTARRIDRDEPSRPPSPTLADALRAKWNAFRSKSMQGESILTALAATPPAAPPRSYDSYDVTFEKGPIGLELETDWYGRQAVVKGFRKVQNNQDGPAKLCGIIRVGDVLTAINGETCLEMSFQETLAKLRDVSGGKHTLHFKSLEAAGDLSVYTNDLDIVQAKKFIHEHKQSFYAPPPRSVTHGLVYGCVERFVGPSVTAFNFYREDTGEFVLACSCVNERTGVFVFHTLQDSHLREFKDLPQSEDSAVYLGQLVPNFLGTEFTLLDHQQKRRNELGFIVYNQNVLGRVPNFLKCVFTRQRENAAATADGESDENAEDQAGGSTSALNPRQAAIAGNSGMGDNRTLFNTHNTMMDRNGNISERFKRMRQSRSFSLVERLRHMTFDDIESQLEHAGGSLESLWHDDDDHAGRGRSMRVRQSRSASAHNFSTPYGAVEQDDFQSDLLVFETKQPSWNEDLGAWTLNFHGRVKMASKKNFLIVAEQGNDRMEEDFGDDVVFLRFGKVTKTRFTLDFTWPMSPMVALAIACSSFAHKIAVT
ncbi:TPA: hypothetical protein N0F65_005490 [Lagenidium giganteum]|uniref:PDZ domain-containing protein n=1 Tax=Lagenidium giganteum TaxID=4803 RepID=A0AAV2YLL2_9STRA|nr:TPA: hypothetical protein N0F65_005490 [Lagenidium giganteum]